MCCTGNRPQISTAGWTDGDIIGIALDLTPTVATPEGSLQYYINGVAQGVIAKSGSYDILNPTTARSAVGRAASAEPRERV